VLWFDRNGRCVLYKRFHQAKFELPKTICTWHEELAELVQPLVEAMRADTLKQPYLCTDATGVLVLAKERCRTGHFWVTVAPERHVLFQYSRRHDSAAVDALLRGCTWGTRRGHARGWGWGGWRPPRAVVLGLPPLVAPPDAQPDAGAVDAQTIH
jgi:hypothetical protein